MREAVNSNEMTPPRGPLSHGVTVNTNNNGLLFLSGQCGFLPDGKLVPGGAVAEAKQAMHNVGCVLRAAGLNYDCVLHCRILLCDIRDRTAVGEVYESYFSKPYPARACFQVAALPAAASVEIEAVAAVPNVKSRL